MAKILKLAFWAAVIYAAVVYGWPWLQETIEGIGTSTASTAKSLSVGEGGRCVDLATKAADDFGGGMREFSTPPYDQGRWSEFTTEIRNEISYAQSECGCPEEPCRIAREALYELETMVGDFDRMIQGGRASSLDAGRDMERVYDILGRARAEIP